MVRAIIEAGGEVQFVSGIVPTLEETYLNLLATEKDTEKDTEQHAEQHAEKNAR